MDKFEYKRNRSGFWVKIHYNDDKTYVISTKKKYVKLINYFFPMFSNNSLTNWKDSPNHIGVCSIYLPKGYYDIDDIEKFKIWCDGANKILWLGINKNLQQHFKDELDFCIACDFNFIPENGRTEIGEAEYQLKYKAQELSEDMQKQYASIMLNYMICASKFVPIHNVNEWFLSPIPTLTSEKDNKLAWVLSKVIANNLGINFIDATLLCKKSQMKKLSVQNKIQTWDNLYKERQISIECNVSDKNIIIVDDLYQSGITMWKYAKYLKSMGAKTVFGLVCVKSLKDSDNV